MILTPLIRDQQESGSWSTTKEAPTIGTANNLLFPFQHCQQTVTIVKHYTIVNYTIHYFNHVITVKGEIALL
jgi:hypothetical protein